MFGRSFLHIRKQVQEACLGSVLLDPSSPSLIQKGQTASGLRRFRDHEAAEKKVWAVGRVEETVCSNGKTLEADPRSWSTPALKFSLGPQNVED